MQSLIRGLDVVRSVMALEPCTLHAIHKDTGLPKPTLLRILATLETMGVVFRPIDDRRYRLSANNFLTRWKPDRRVALQEISVTVLSKLCRDAVWPSDLVVREGSSMIVVASNRMLSPFAIKPTAHGHQPDMLLTAVGRAYLAYCDADERNAIVEAIRAEQPGHPMLRDMAALELLLQQTRAQGYGVRSEYKPDGFSAIAVPVLIAERPAACLNLFYYKSAVSRENIVADHLPKLHSAAREIAGRLGAGDLSR